MPTRVWIEPIYDRTQADVDRAREFNTRGFFNLTPQEQALWQAGMKGSLNRSDLERIENDIQILSDVFELGLHTYADNIPEIPNVAYYNNLRSNLTAIYNSGYIHPDTPTPSHSPFNEYSKVNDAEKMLADIEHILQSNFYYYCTSPAQIYAGESIGTLL